MKIIKIACLLSLLLSFAAASEFVPSALTHSSPGVFGYTDIGTAYEVDTGAGLVFQVRKTDGSIVSIVFNGTEYKSTTNRFSQIASGLGTPTTVTPETDGATYVKITLQTDAANGVAANLTHYLIVRNGENIIYMATLPTAEPGVGELRWITRLNSALIPNGPGPSDLHGNTGAIESTDIFGMPDGTTRSKYYGDNITHGKDRAIDLSYSGATGPGIGCWMVFGNRESSSGGPFFRDIENQSGDDQEIYNYMNSGHNQTEAYRLSVLHGPYALVFTSGIPPTLPIDFSWIGNLGLNGWVAPADRGAVSGTTNGIPAGFQTVVGFTNSTAQYWSTAAPDGSYTSSGMKPGTYAATLYKGELEVATDSVTVSTGTTTTLNLTSTEPTPSTIFRIGNWDGTPAGLMNADKIVLMHPQDVRNTPWDVTTYTVGLDDPIKFPAIQFRGQNSPTTIKFNLAPNQIVNLTLRIGITCAYNNGRPQITVNSFTSGQPAASTQPNSRSFTLGTYRGNNALFTYSIPASALVVGTNTMTINPISGSTDISQWLSAGWVYDAVELDGPIATPVITYVGGNPLVISGTAEPFRNIALTLDGSILAGNTVSSGTGSWSITYNAAISAGPHSFTAVASDDNGHSSPASAPFTFNSSIATPEITSAVGDDGAHASGATTADRTFIFNGTAGAGDQVALTRVGTGVIATVAADATGHWTFDYTSVALPAGTNSFYATASNGSGTSASSAIFTLNIQGTPRITIVRFDPTTATISSGVTSVVFRVTFRDSVSGVTTSAFKTTTNGTAAGTIASVSAGSGTIFDVTVNNLSGSGMLRLDLKSSNGIIIDSSGNPEAGYTAGESYNLVLPTIGPGTWIQPLSGGLWSDPSNWLNAVIADGGNTANFNTLDLTANNTVHLDSPRTISSIAFGDTDPTTPASWLLDNNNLATNTLALVGATPTITVNTLGAGATSTIGATLVGTGGLTKTGAGTLVLSAPNQLSGVLNLNGGFVQLTSGGSLNLGNSAVNTALNTRLVVAGGSFTTTGLVSATTSQVVIDSGTAALGSFRTNSDFSGTLRINGGTLNVGDVNIRRNAGASPDFTSGFIVTGGTASASTIGLGTQNSYGSMSLEGGSLTATGTITIANQATSGRGGSMRVLNNAVFASTDSSLGVLMCRNNGTNANNVATATFTGGSSSVEKFTLGFDGAVTAGSATITINGGAIYLGSGGIIKNGGAGLATNLNFSSGTLGAKSDWSTNLPINLPNGGNITFRGADAANVAHNISLNGVLSGNGGFTKTGGGTLALRAANTFAGAVAVNAGTLDADGSIASGNGVAVNSGGTLTGDGSINRNVVLNSGSILRPGSATTGSALSATSLLWNADAVFAFDLGSTTNQLTLSGALTKGSAGPHNFVFTPQTGLASGNVYTLATFGSTDFSAADLTFSGLPAGLTGAFNVTGNAIQFEIFGPPEIVSQPQSVSTLIGGTATFSVTVNPSPMLTYQWYKDGDPIPGATNASLTITNVQAFDIGSYTVTISNAAGSTASNPANLSIAPVALVRHAPTLNGLVTGSIQQMLAENVTLNGNASVSDDLRVPGTPIVVVNGSPNFGGTIDGSGSALPSNYNVTLNSNTTLGHLVRRTDPVAMPSVNAPTPPAGNRSVTINNPNQSAGDWATLLNLTLNANAGAIAVPPGAYGNFTANGNNGFILGVPGSHVPAIYSFQSLTLNTGAQVQVVGPVLLIVASGFNVNGGAIGNSAHPAWLALEIFAGDLTLNNGGQVFGYVTALAGTLRINGNCQVTGGGAIDRLTINSNGKLVLLN